MRENLENENRLLFALLISLFSIFGYYFWIGFGDFFFKNNLALFSISGQIIFFGAIPFIFDRLYRAQKKASIRFLKINIQLIPFIVLIFIGLQAFISSSTNLQELIIPQQFLDSYRDLEKMVETNYSSIMKFDSIINIIITIFMIVVTPAIFEEVFFRKFLLNELVKRINPLLAIIVTSFVFSIVHFNPIHLFQLFAFGFILGLLAYRTGNIIYSILLHFLNNGLSLIAYYFTQNESIADAVSFGWEYVITNILLLALGIIIILLCYKKIINLTKIEFEYINNDGDFYEKT